MFSKRSALVTAACLVAIASQGAATGTAVADPRDPTKGRDHASAAPVKPAGKPGTVSLSTADSKFDSLANNQGWWSTDTDNYDLNDNIIVGPYLGEYRNFLTFDITPLGKHVTSAVLTVNASWVNGFTGSELLQLHDVSTDAETLNANDGRNPAIFEDLGTGELYGEYNLSGVQNDEELSLTLDTSALRDLRAAVKSGDRFFSVGGRLVNGAPGSFIFGNSGPAPAVLSVRTH